MNFHRRRNRGNFESRRFFIVFSVLLLSILTFFVLRSPLYSLITFFFNGENYISSSVRNTAGLFRSKSSLVEENNLLKDKLLYYESLDQALDSSLRTQEEILKLFGRGEATKFIAAGVLVKPIDTPYDIVVIDVGSNDGVGVGSLVSNIGGGAIGRVVEVLSNQSRVELFSTSGVKTKAFLERGDESVELIGVGGGGFAMLLPKKVDVILGDMVMTSGLNTEPIAQVLEVTLLPTDALKKVLLKSVVNINNLRFVEVHQ